MELTPSSFFSSRRAPTWGDADTAYKPLRNHLRKTEIIESLATIHAYVQYLQFRTTLPADENLVSQFQYLPVPPPEAHATPPVFMVFDCLDNGRDIRAEPLARRREALEAAIDGGTLLFPARRLPPHGLDAWATVKKRGYEGLVAKHEHPPYRGGTTRSWLKVKVRYEGVFIVGGILGTADAPEGLLVGERVGRRLIYRGGSSGV